MDPAGRGDTRRLWARGAARRTGGGPLGDDYHRALVAALAEGVVVVGADGHVVSANPAAREMLALGGDELVGGHAVEPGRGPVTPGGRPFPVDRLPAVTSLRTGRAFRRLPMGVRRSDGCLIWIEVSTQPLYRDGEPLPDAVVISFADVTARRGAEEAVRRGRAEQAALREVATAVAAGAEPEQVFALVARQARRLCRTSGGAVVRVAGDALVVVGQDGPSARCVGSRTPRGGTSASATAVRQGRAVRVDDYAQVDPATRAAFPGVGSAAAAPIAAHGRTWGAVAVLSAGPRGIRADAEEALGHFCELVGLAVESAEQRARLLELATTDALTGLANHRVFHERLDAEVTRATRHGRALAVAVLDLDHFKDVNDRHGHVGGDRVLREVAARLQALARSGDLLGRLGGDELGWLMPETDEAGALEAVERARAAFASAPFAEAGRLTLSGGVCDLAQADGHASALVELADSALYWAKATGRDRVVAYRPEVLREFAAHPRSAHFERAQGLAALRALARAVDAKDHATHAHSERVAQLAGDLAQAAGWEPGRVAQLREAALLHDVGKIGVPDAILLKPGPLDAREYRRAKSHAQLGAEIVAEVLSAEQASWVRHHHERWDGAGYPDGLRGAQIPLGARLLALADAYETMTSGRSWREALLPRQALAEIAQCVGGQFCPEGAALVQRVVGTPDLSAHPTR